MGADFLPNSVLPFNNLFRDFRLPVTHSVHEVLKEGCEKRFKKTKAQHFDLLCSFLLTFWIWLLSDLLSQGSGLSLVKVIFS